MRKRKRLHRRLSKKLFSRTARKFHKRNLNTSPMRGGIRL